MFTVISICGWAKAKVQQKETRNPNSPVFSFISHKTLKRAGFILWQFSACFLKGEQDTTLQMSIVFVCTRHGVCVCVVGWDKLLVGKFNVWGKGYTHIVFASLPLCPFVLHLCKKKTRILVRKKRNKIKSIQTSGNSHKTITPKIFSTLPRFHRCSLYKKQDPFRKDARAEAQTNVNIYLQSTGFTFHCLSH